MNPGSMPPVPNADNQHLKLIEIFHYILGGLNLLGIPFLFIHYTFMHAIFMNPKIWQDQKQPPPFDPAQVFQIFVWFYLFMGAVMAGLLILNVSSGLCIRARKGRLFSLIVAGIDCLWIPFGTALGIFTFIVLLRPTMGLIYGEPPPR